MKIFSDTILYNKLKKIHDDKGRYIGDSDVAKALWNNIPERISMYIIVFGGLDHVQITDNSYIFCDIGCNDKNGSFRIMKEKV